MDLIRKKWIPDKSVSHGAQAYHETVIKSSWYDSNLKKFVLEFLDLKHRDVVVDFGAGTGISSLYLYEHIDEDCELLLVDNSPSWLAKSYEIFSDKSNVSFFVLGKNCSGYEKLSDIIGVELVDAVLSANTVHLIEDLSSTFLGIYESLKLGGAFIFHSGNISRDNRDNDVLAIESSIEDIHSIAIEIIKTDKRFSKYVDSIDNLMISEYNQRKIIFPDSRTTEYYMDCLVKSGFKNIELKYFPVEVLYDDWRNFIKIKRIQSGVLPEIGGRNPNEEQQNDRNIILDMAMDEYIMNLWNNNHFATDEKFVVEWICMKAVKI